MEFRQVSRIARFIFSQFCLEEILSVIFNEMGL